MRSGVLDRIEEARQQRQFIKREDEAMRIFTAQQSALLAISKSEGFMEIRNFRLRIYDACIQRLATCKSRDYEDVQVEMRVAKRFLDFLDNITNPIELP